MLQLGDRHHEFLCQGIVRATLAHMEQLDFLSAEDKDWVMGRAILARLKWPAAAQFNRQPAP